MTPDLQTRIAAIKAECEKVIELDKLAANGPMQTIYGTDSIYLRHIRNVSPAMARVVLGMIERCMSLASERHHGRPYLAMLESIANQWEGK